jgi:hypothetical protein
MANPNWLEVQIFEETSLRGPKFGLFPGRGLAMADLKKYEIRKKQTHQNYR